MREVDSMQAYLAAHQRKMRLLLYYLVRRLASVYMYSRRESDRIYVWPPFDDFTEKEQLFHLHKNLHHFLGNVSISVEYYLRSSSGLKKCLLNLPSHSTVLEEFIAEPTVRRNLREARYCLIWRRDGRAHRTSTTPYLYVIENSPENSGVNEWIRLVTDVYRSRVSIPKRIVPFPDYPVKSCAVLGSGPSAEDFEAESDQWDAWIGANSVICNEKIRHSGKPFALCLLDPLYFAPLSSMDAFWQNAFDLLRETPAVLITTLDYAAFIELNFPDEIKKKCHYVKTVGHDTPNFLTRDNLQDLIITPYGNVLNDLMLPVAASISRSIMLYGCDGQAPGEESGYLPKAASLQSHETAVWEEVGSGFHDTRTYKQYLSSQNLFTRYLVSDCIRKGVKIALRRPSWNTGLQGLPVLDEGYGVELGC